MDLNSMEVILVPVLIGLLEVIKKTGFNSKFIPALAIVLGVVLGVIYSGCELKEGILMGIVVGLSSVGLYSGVDNTLKGVKSFKDYR